MPLIDKFGVPRHTLPRTQLEALYKALENFIGDCTVEEYDKDKEAFNKIKTAIHKRMRTSESK